MVHIKKKKKSLSEPHPHYYPLSSEPPASPDCLLFPEDCIRSHLHAWIQFLCLILCGHPYHNYTTPASRDNADLASVCSSLES